MDSFPTNPLPPPPPPPPAPRKSRVGLWIGIILGVVAICLCVVIIGGVVWVNRTSIPGISSLFATPTPQGVYYSNSALGFSLYYPSGWVYNEQGTDSVVFATSQAVLDAPDTPTEGAAIGFIVAHESDLNLPSTVDASSPASILGALTNTVFAGNVQVLEGPTTYTLKSSPAASNVLLVTPSGSSPFNAYMNVLLQNGHVIVSIGITPQGQIQQYRSTFDNILTSFMISN
ncbi:MAG TPA: hypothetical protein VMC09_12370 [Anaerolineales bacterium]|nr:hypothetical protein [Anaerolineales bacterium]